MPPYRPRADESKHPWYSDGELIARFLRVMVRFIPLIFFALSAAITPATSGHLASPANLSTVHFPISCTSVQGKFDQAIALLHNFFYPETVKAFQAIIAQDPDCAIAYWGLAMSQRPNPLVPPFPIANLKAGLEAVQQGKKARVQTPREAEYLRAMQAFYEGYDKIDQQTRTRLYEAAMQRLHEHYPDDAEAAIFYALALNEAVDLKDRTFARQLKAAAILHAQARNHPNHPGIAHYLIHSYDFTPLAKNGLSSAHLYDKIAASAPHALHMPSHTYSMLGMWQQSIVANQAAKAAAIAYAADYDAGQIDPSLPHILDFLEFAYLQLAKDSEARKIVDELPNLKKFASVRLGVDTALAAIPARFALERGKWDEAARLKVRDSQYPAAQSISYFARALGAARAGDPRRARSEIAHLKQIENNLLAAKENYWAGQTRIQSLAAEAWVIFDEGRPDEAIAAMRDAADLDDASEKNVAMENKLVPMRALLGELYLAAGRNREALIELQSSLKASPNRFRTFAAAAAAARAMGSVVAARDFHRDVVRLAGAGDGGRAEVVEAREFLSGS